MIGVAIATSGAGIMKIKKRPFGSFEQIFDQKNGIGHWVDALALAGLKIRKASLNNIQTF